MFFFPSGGVRGKLHIIRAHKTDKEVSSACSNLIFPVAHWLDELSYLNHVLFQIRTVALVHTQVLMAMPVPNMANMLIFSTRRLGRFLMLHSGIGVLVCSAMETLASHLREETRGEINMKIPQRRCTCTRQMYTQTHLANRIMDIIQTHRYLKMQTIRCLFVTDLL